MDASTSTATCASGRSGCWPRWRLRRSTPRKAARCRQRCSSTSRSLRIPFVSPVVISIFICRTVAGTSYLVADYTIHCHTPVWKLAVAWCSLWFAGYVMGMPALVMLAVRAAGWRVVGPHQRRGYRVDGEQWIVKYWEVLEMVRKLFLTTLVLLFNKGTTMQIALACVWSLVFLMAHTLYQPFKDPADNRLQTLALSSLSATYFIGVLIQVRPTAGQSAQFATLLTILTAVVACVATISTTLHAYKRGAGAVRKHQGQLSQLSSSALACCTNCFAPQKVPERVDLDSSSSSGSRSSARIIPMLRWRMAGNDPGSVLFASVLHIIKE